MRIPLSVLILLLLLLYQSLLYVIQFFMNCFYSFC